MACLGSPLVHQPCMQSKQTYYIKQENSTDPVISSSNSISNSFEIALIDRYSALKNSAQLSSTGTVNQNGYPSPQHQLHQHQTLA